MSNSGTYIRARQREGWSRRAATPASRRAIEPTRSGPRSSQQGRRQTRSRPRGCCPSDFKQSLNHPRQLESTSIRGRIVSYLSVRARPRLSTQGEQRRDRTVSSGDSCRNGMTRAKDAHRNDRTKRRPRDRPLTGSIERKALPVCGGSVPAARAVLSRQLPADRIHFPLGPLGGQDCRGDEEVPLAFRLRAAAPRHLPQRRILEATGRHSERR